MRDETMTEIELKTGRNGNTMFLSCNRNIVATVNQKQIVAHLQGIFFRPHTIWSFLCVAI